MNNTKQMHFTFVKSLIYVAFYHVNIAPEALGHAEASLLCYRVSAAPDRTLRIPQSPKCASLNYNRVIGT